MTTKSTEIREMIEEVRRSNLHPRTAQSVLYILDALNRRMDEMEAGQKRSQDDELYTTRAKDTP